MSSPTEPLNLQSSLAECMERLNQLSTRMGIGNSVIGMGDNADGIGISFFRSTEPMGLHRFKQRLIASGGVESAHDAYSVQFTDKQAFIDGVARMEKCAAQAASLYVVKR